MRPILALMLAATVVATAVAAAAYAVGDSTAPATPEPHAVAAFHWTAYDADGHLVMTTDPVVARAAIAAGAHLPANLSAYPYGERRVRLDGGNGTDPLSVAPYLAGLRPGESVRTGLLPEPFGDAPVTRIDRVRGPFAVQEVLDAELPLNGTVRSDALDMDVTLSARAGGVALRLDPLLGDDVEVRTCRLVDLPPGNYTVVSVTAEDVGLVRADDPRAPAYGRDLDLELRLVSVERSD